MIKMLHFISHFSSFEIAYKWWEKKMMIGRSRWKVGDDVPMYIHTSLAFVFRLRCVLLSPSLSLSLSLPLCLSSSFFKKLRVHKRIICVRISSSSSSLPDMFYNHSNIVCRCMCTSKKTNREKERTKDAKKLSIECV